MNDTAETPAKQTSHPIMEKLNECTHDKFHIFADVTKLLDIGGFIVDARIVCVECGTPFCFLGLPMGKSIDTPSVSMDGLEARLPICPAPNSSPTIL
jgi:hypothetical protein